MFQYQDQKIENDLLTYISNAKYAYTFDAELKKNFEKREDENVLIKQKITLNGRLAYMILTDKRLFFLRHYLFHPDKVISVNLKYVDKLKLKNHFLGFNKSIFIHISTPDQFMKFKIKSLARNNHYSNIENNTEKLYEKLKEVTNYQL